MACLRLANSSNQHEAALAASRAQEIIDRYKLDISDLDYDTQSTKDDAEPVQDFGYEDPLDHVKYGWYRETWCIRLASVISRSNQCRIVYRRQPDKSRKIRIFGRPSDVSTVRYLYGFFRAQVEALAKTNCAGHSSAYFGQFCTGVIDTLTVKLTASREELFKSKRDEYANNPMALVKVNGAIAKMDKKAADVEAFMDQAVGKMRPGRGGFTRTYTGGREQGQEAGKSLRMTGAKASLGAGRREIQ